MTIPFLDLRRVTELASDELKEAARRVIDSGWFLRGKETAAFEQAYADYIGTPYCVGCGNGLDALTLIFRSYIALGVLKEGDEVIVPANTYIASILSITENRLVPVLVEADADTLQIDDRLIERAITSRTRALLIVHLYGRLAYTPLIGDLCRRHGLLLIEDNAQAHGLRWQGQKTGALGDAAAHSFYPTKNMGALGDAGAVTTRDAQLADMVRAMGNYGSARHYVFDYQGRNSRIDELQAALLQVKLRHLDTWNERRQEIATTYLNGIHNDFVTLPRNSRPSVWHIFPILSPYRDELHRFLSAKGIGTDIHYPIPPHQQSCFPAWNQLHFPITERIAHEELSLPCNPSLTDAEVSTVIQAVNNFRPACE